MRTIESLRFARDLALTENTLFSKEERIEFCEAMDNAITIIHSYQNLVSALKNNKDNPEEAVSKMMKILQSEIKPSILKKRNK